jgi:hypothetical protein
MKRFSEKKAQKRARGCIDMKTDQIRKGKQTWKERRFWCNEITTRGTKRLAHMCQHVKPAAYLFFMALTETHCIPGSLLEAGNPQKGMTVMMITQTHTQTQTRQAPPYEKRANEEGKHV